MVVSLLYHDVSSNVTILLIEPRRAVFEVKSEGRLPRMMSDKELECLRTAARPSFKDLRENGLRLQFKTRGVRTNSHESAFCTTTH